MFDRSTGEIRTFGTAEDEGGEYYKGAERAQAETAGYDGDAAGGLDAILASDGGLSGDGEVRGPVTQPPEPAYPPPPPAPKEPHLVYSQRTGELTGPDGQFLASGYAGRGGGVNNPDAEDIKGVGPLPQGNWRIGEAKDKPWPPPSYKLTPDEETRRRVKELGRDPDSFYIHAKARRQEDQGRDSAGCIALGPRERDKLGVYLGRWIRVEK